MRTHKQKLQQGLAELRAGREPKVDARELAYEADPLPHERAVLELASAYDCDKAAVTWASQEKAVNFYNAHGLARTLDEIVRVRELVLAE